LGAAADGREAPHPSTSGTVRGAPAAPGRRRSTALPELLPLGAALRHRVPAERQAGTEGGGRALPAPPGTNRRCPRGERAQGQLHPPARGRAGGAPQRGDRRDTGTGDAPCPGGGVLLSRDLAAARRPQPEVSFLRLGGAAAPRTPRPRTRACPLQPAGVGGSPR